MLRRLWRHHYFILSSVRNELVNNLRRSRFGLFWLVAQPLALVTIYTIILSNVLAAKLPGVESGFGYAVYLMAGLVAWFLFNDIIMRTTHVFTSNADLIKKMSFPRSALAAIAVGNALVSNAIFMIIVLLAVLVLGIGISGTIIWLLPVFLLTMLFGLGIGLLMGVFQVFVRDFGQGVPIVLQFGFWFTPIVYPIGIIEEQYQHLFAYNPFYHFTSSYQNILVFQEPPESSSLLVLAVLAVSTLALALFTYRRALPEMADAL